MPRHRITVQDIARHLGVSPGTVSLALNDSPGVRSETRRRIKEYAAEVQYQPNQMARGIKDGRSRLVAVVLTRVNASFHEMILQGVENTAVSRGYDIIVSSIIGDDAEAKKRNAEQLVRRLIGRRIDALAAPVYSLPESAAALLDDAGIPIVYFSPEPVAGRTTVTVDNLLGGRLAGEHLDALGHRRILFLGTAGPYAELRAEGARRVLEERGNGGTLEMRLVDSDAVPSAYYALASRLRSRRDFTAIFCANDVIAAGAYKALLDAGVSIPNEMSVVGFDDLHWTELITPALTTVRQPQASQGEVAMELMIEWIEGDAPPQSRVLTPRLVVRDSTAPIEQQRS